MAGRTRPDTAPGETPPLYVRGAKEGGDIGVYVDGFRKAGIRNVRSA